VTESPQTAVPKANGLSTLLNVIAAPKEAFETLREAPTWGWALLVTLVLSVVGAFLMVPALQHASDAAFPQMVASNPNMAGMSAEKLAQIRTFTHNVIGFSPILVIFGLFIGILIQTLVMLILNAIGKGSGTFKTLWASSWNVAVTAGIGAILLAVIVLLRGADSFDSQAAVQAAMPNLGLLAPHLGKLTNFLSAFTPFSLWGAWLIVQAMLFVARAPKGIAWTTGIISVIVPALFTLAAPGAK
jgi:hypothetical protein